MWLDYPHRSRDNEPWFGGGELVKHLSNTYDIVSQDRTYDDGEALFPSVLASAANIDFLTHRTTLVDDLLRRYHRSDALVMSNSQSVSLTSPY
jgi:hypothetical protein